RSGEPSGLLVDRAWENVFHRIPPLGAEDRASAILLALQQLASKGYTMVGSAGSLGRLGLLDLLAAGGEEAEQFRGLATAGRLPIRVSLMIPGPSDAAEGLLRRGPEVGLAEGRLDIRTIQLVADGAFAAHGAALMQPYADDGEQSGALRLTSGEIASWAGR